MAFNPVALWFWQSRYGIRKKIMKTNKAVLPTIHINGTSAQDLTDGYTQARRAAQDAMTALSQVEFNSRDYYPQGQMAWLDAVRERQELFNKLSQVSAALYEIEIHCSDFIK